MGFLPAVRIYQDNNWSNLDDVIVNQELLCYVTKPPVFPEHRSKDCLHVNVQDDETVLVFYK